MRTTYNKGSNLAKLRQLLNLPFSQLNFSSYCLTAILVAAAILRFNHINQPYIDGLSWWQTSTAMMADNFFRHNWNIFLPEISWNGADPSYSGREFQTVSYLASLIYHIVGEQDWVGRSISVLFGLWGIFALYQLVRRVWDEERALLSAAVMALLPGSIFIERSFLPDPAMVALMTTSFWMLVAYLQTKRFWYLVLAGTIACLGVLTKLPGLIVGIPMIYVLIVVLKRRKLLNAEWLLGIAAMIWLTLLPVIAYYVWAWHLTTSYPLDQFADANNWVWTDGLGNWFSKGYFLPQLIQQFNGWIWTSPVIVLVFFGLFLFPLPQDKSKQTNRRTQPSAGSSINLSVNARWVFHIWFLAGVLYYLIAAKQLVGNPATFHVINPAAAALVGNAIFAIVSSMISSMRSPMWWAAISILLIVIGGFGQSSLQWMYSSYAEQNYELGLALRQRSQPSDLVVTIANPLGDSTAIYYSQRRGWVFPSANKDTGWNVFPSDDREAIAMLKQLEAKSADWFGIVSAQNKTFWVDHSVLADYVRTTYEFAAKTDDWVIYHIPSAR